MWCGIAKLNAGLVKKTEIGLSVVMTHISSVAILLSFSVSVCMSVGNSVRDVYLFAFMHCNCSRMCLDCVLCSQFIHIECFSVGVLRCRHCTQQSNGEQKSFGINIIIWISCRSFASNRTSIAKHEPNSFRRPHTRHSECESKTRMH